MAEKTIKKAEEAKLKNEEEERGVDMTPEMEDEQYYQEISRQSSTTKKDEGLDWYMEDETKEEGLEEK